ncbi:hypothetical protein [Mesorhizobium sp.]
MWSARQAFVMVDYRIEDHFVDTPYVFLDLDFADTYSFCISEQLLDRFAD